MLKRLSLLFLAALAAWRPAAAAGDADMGVEMKYMYYWDRNDAWNHTPAVTFFKKLASVWKLQWQQEFDFVSGASRRLGLRNGGQWADHYIEVDALSGASRREMRHSEQASVAYANEGRAASASFYFSDENDYRSYSPAVAGAWDFNQRNTTVSAAFSAFFDELRPQKGFEDLGGHRRIFSLQAGLTQLVSPMSMVSFTVQPIHGSGVLGHPYNPVITDSGALVSEQLPPHRLSVAFAATYVHGFHLAGRLGSLHIMGRHYRDDWELASNTVDFQWYQYLAGGAWIRLRMRGYAQGAAAFARESYRGDERYRTPDIRYYAFSNTAFGAKIGSPFPESWQESGWMPDRWDMGYDYGPRNTRGELGGGEPMRHYQLFSPDLYYVQGTFMAGLAFDL